MEQSEIKQLLQRKIFHHPSAKQFNPYSQQVLKNAIQFGSACIFMAAIIVRINITNTTVVATDIVQIVEG